MSRAVRAILVAIVVMVAPVAHGQPASEGADYDADSAAWNGLGTLEALARGMGFDVLQQSAIAWDDLERTDILLLLYPTRRLEPGHLAAFLRNGGRILVADDFGKSEEALSGLGILRGPGVGVRSPSFYDDQPFAPVARALAPDHALAAGVDGITTNHPAVWKAARGATSVFGFDDGDSIVATVELGDGRLVALSDPSVLINRMLEFEGNLGFAINVLRYLGRPGETERVVLLSGEMSLYGEPSRLLGDTAARGSVTGVLGDFNRWLLGLNDYLLTETSMRVLAITIALITCILALLILPRARRAALDGSWTRARGGAPESPGSEAVLEALDRPGGARRSFALPATVLRDSVNGRLALLVGHADPLYGMSEGELFAAVDRAAGPAAVAAVRALHVDLRALPTRAQAASPWEAPFLHEREFQRLSAAADRLYRSLEGES